MKSRKKIGIIILVVIVTIVFILPLVAFGIVKWGILPPEKLTPLVTREAGKYLNGHLDFERIELTYFDTYPYLGVRLINGHLVSYATRDSISVAEDTFEVSDSLVSFRRAVISVNPADYLFRDRITIARVLLDSPDIYAYINEEGKANWDVYIDEEELNEEKDSVSALPVIDLQKVRIRNGHFIFDDRQADMYGELDSLSLRLDGDLTQKANKVEIKSNARSVYFEDRQGDIYAKLDSVTLDLKGALSRRGTGFKIETSSASVYFDSPSYTLENNLAIQFKSKVGIASDLNTIRLAEAEMMINNLPFTADGKIINLPDSNQVRIDMDMALKISDLNDLLAFVPDIYFKDRKKLQAKGAVFLEGSVHGLLGDSIMPTINLACKVEQGSYHMKGVKQGIDDFEMDMDIHLNGAYPDSSFVKLDHLKIDGLNTSFALKGKVENIYKSPFIEGTMKGKVDFTRLAQEFLNPDTFLLEGIMVADMAASFNLDDLMDGKYNKVQAAGSLNIDELRAVNKPNDMNIFLSKVSFSVDSVKQTSSFIKDNDQLLSGFLKIDSMNIRYKDEINTSLKYLDAQAKTSSVIDTTSVIPLTTSIKVERLRSRLPDSVWVFAHNSHLQGGIRPSASNKQIPNIAASIKVDTLRYFDAPSRTGLILATNMFNIEALPYRDALRQKNQRRSQESRENSRNQRIRQNSENNRTGTRTQPGSRNQDKKTTQNDSTGLQRHNRDSRAGSQRNNSVPERNQNLSLNNRQQYRNGAGNSSTSRFLRNWEVRGSVKFNQMRIFSKYFPLRMRMSETSVRFDTDKITLKDACLRAGKSDLTFSGELSSLRRAVMRGGILKGDFSIKSEYIDCNQLLTAMNRGLWYAEQGIGSNNAADNFTEMSENALEQSFEEIEADSLETLFVVPRNLDVTLKLDAKKIDVQELNLENVSGELVMRNQSISLKKLDMDSDIGSASLTMVYTAKDHMEASTGFELKMDDILVDKLIGLFPAIDSLLPMLRSFEGVVDCQMAATCSLDSTMSVVLPSLHSACYLYGKDMVLLDGETFSEISKTLMFKNKNRNVIDSISVDLLIKDNKIEVFPFLVEMDRYRVAVGGEHHLDMSFDYHLSVLKSPVPFKLGIDIRGNLDKFKYKIVKCRYKDIFKPAREAELDATRTNLRSGIREVIRKEMAANAPELLQDFDLDQSVRTRVRSGSNSSVQRQQWQKQLQERQKQEEEQQEASQRDNKNNRSKKPVVIEWETPEEDIEEEL